ncbi:family 43 glycosylhydrolase [Arthrobacter sp. ISL-48]|uniref:family 43 glycosylhydrolase n=1 Tax=Arthrobacter sp. ISL-48 TaxID=2819110 RepID=UPI001BE85E8B|nr:family 43 glycosylhydrolase [Arthrobacter sp. ISL-48]MBT2531139.1 family 43 glycosylhydrolase [Arthrobacter sp. ISL-48]
MTLQLRFKAALAALLIAATSQLAAGAANATTTAPTPSPTAEPTYLFAFGANGAGQTTLPAGYKNDPIVQLAAGNSHTVAVTQPGRLLAWGSNAAGQSTVPATGKTKFSAVAAGASHSLALSKDGGVIAWGGNSSGQSTVPTAALSGIKEISAGGSNSLALKTDNSLVAWGDNAFAQNQIPGELAGKHIVQTATGSGFNLALDTTGQVTAWGRSDVGQLEIPAEVKAARIIAISAGVTHSLALTADGKVLAWGSNAFGQLNVPAELAAEKVTAIVAGGYHNLVATESGKVFAWGENNAGQSTLPAGLGAKVVAMAAGETHSVLFTRPDDGAAAVPLSGQGLTLPPQSPPALFPAAAWSGALALAAAVLGMSFVTAAGFAAFRSRLHLAVRALSTAKSAAWVRVRRLACATLAAAVGASLLIPANPAIAVEGAPAGFPEPTLAQLVSTNGVLYFANSGASVTDKVADGDTLGIFQSRSDQPLGQDAKTGGSWGYVSDAFSNPKANTSTTLGKYDSILYDAPPAGSVLSQRAIKYDFDLPSGSYDVTFGFKLPSGWAGRTMDLMAEGAILGTASAGSTTMEKTFTLQVTDGTLNLQAHSQAGRTNTFLDPALNFVLIRKPLDYTTALLGEKVRQASLSQEQAALYAADSVDALQQKLAAAQSLVDAASTDSAAIRAAYEAIDATTKALRKLVTYDTFRPGQPWLDNNAKAIQAHGGQVIPTKDAAGKTIYYWYGEDRSNGYQPMPGVHAYSSYDLYNWKDEGLALKALTSRAQLDSDPYFTSLYADYTTHEKDAVFRDLDSNGSGNAVGRAVVLERPKVIYNKSTNKWVLWVHADGPSATSDAQYAKAQAGVAVSDSPFGPFRYVDSYRLDQIPANDPNNQYPSQLGMARDMNLFQDDDAAQTGYIVYSSEENRTMYVSRLNASYMYLNVPKSRSVNGVDFSRSFQGQAREAPAMFKYDGMYYLITSEATGWAANPARYATASSPLGPWTQHGNPAIGPNANTTFSSQSTSVIPVDAAAGKFIYMGDRWTPSDLANAPQVWLPMTFDANGGLTFDWHDTWKLQDLENRGKFSAQMDVPKQVALGAGPSALPSTAVVTQNGTTTTSAVTWSGAAFNTPGSATVTATFASNGRSTTYSVLVVPKGTVYLADPGGSDTQDYADLREAVSAPGPLSNSVKDQPLGPDPTTGKVWGYDNPGTSTTSGSSMFATLRYVTQTASRKDLSYIFGALDPGQYTVYIGLFDPWASSAPNRAARISINGTVVTASQRIGGTDTTLTYAGRSPDAAGKLNVNLAPTTVNDIQLSWIMVVKN